MSNYHIFLVITILSISSETLADEKLCRTRGRFLNEENFALDTCALCYHYLMIRPGSIINPAKVIEAPHLVSNKSTPSMIYQLQINNITVLADPDDKVNPLLLTFKDEHARYNWKSCCAHAVHCCRTMLSETTKPVEGWCPRTWDGWQCWGDAEPNTSQLAPCPSHIAIGANDPSCMFASKKCEADGKWYKSIATGEEWTNFSTCSMVPNLQRRAYVSITAYSITIIALVPALAIFSFYRQLRVARVALHRQLFASLLLNSAAVITLKSLVLLPMSNVNKQSLVLDQNGVVCKILLIITKYLRLTNYMWMFCEGFYLHRLISAAFVENHSLLLFYLIGWGSPLIPIGIYVGVRIINESGDNCWAFPAGFSEWFLYIPCLLSLALNFIFLIDIIRILWLKLRARHQDEPSQYRKAVRATLVLVPLFGLHLILTMYRPQSGTCDGTFIQWYYILDYLMDGLQGFLVALTFCYCNGEVHSLLKRSYQRFLLRYRPDMVMNSWASSMAPPAGGNNHTTVSLAEAPQQPQCCKRARNNCCRSGPSDDAQSGM